MADEVNQQERSPELPPGEESPPEVEEVVSQGEASELESDEAQEVDGQAKAEERLVELEQLVAVKDSEIAALGEAKVELEGRALALSDSLAEAVASYRVMVQKITPPCIP